MQINFKWGIYAAITALILAFTTSLFLGQASFHVAVLRAFLFAALFFVLGAGVWTLINTFIPELLFPESDNATTNIFGTESPGLQGSDSQLYGSRINITLGDGATDAALPDNGGSDSEEVGNIADLVSGAIDPAGDAKRQRGIDETNENSYTTLGETTAPSSDGLAEPVYAEETGGLAMNFDSFAMDGSGGGKDPFGDAFSISADSGGTAKKEEVLPERKVTGNKPMALEGDFNPKDIALGIRTVLENDKKG